MQTGPLPASALFHPLPTYFPARQNCKVWPAEEKPATLQTSLPRRAHQSRGADSNQSLFRPAGALWTGGGLMGPPIQICHRGWAASRRHRGPPVGTRCCQRLPDGLPMQPAGGPAFSSNKKMHRRDGEGETLRWEQRKRLC